MSEPREHDPLADGRDAYRAKRWSEAARLLAEAEERARLSPEDYEALTTARFLISPDQVGGEIMGTASTVLLERGDVARAARAAFWAGATHNRLAEFSTGSGWIVRGQRLLEDAGVEECVERGYLLIAPTMGALRAGEVETALGLIGDISAIGRRFGDAGLLAFIHQAEGRRTAPGQTVPGRMWPWMG